MDLRSIGVTLPQQRVAEARPGDESTLYDLIIIGGGPAGMTAAVYSARKGMATLLITTDLGGQALWTSEIENYMGYQFITGEELAARFEDQLKKFPIALHLDDKVEQLSAESPSRSPAESDNPTGRHFTATTRSGKHFRGRMVIIASGKRPRKLNVPGEAELIGRGVSYCATCDAPLFSGKDMAVIGGGNSAFTAVADLIPIARQISVVNFAHDWQADPVLLERAELSGKVVPFLGHEVSEILGQGKVEGIVIRPRDEGQIQTLAVQGIFVEIGLTPNTDFAQGLVQLNDAGEVVVDCKGRTSVPGVFAAGDATTVPEKQIIIAAGEGAKSALSAYEYLLLEVRP